MSNLARAANNTKCCVRPHFVVVSRDEWKPLPVLAFTVLQVPCYSSDMLLVHMDVLVCGSCSQQFCPLRMVKKWCGIKCGCARHPSPCSSFPLLLLPSIALTFPCVHSFWTDVICKYSYSPRCFPFLRGHSCKHRALLHPNDILSLWF